MKIRQMASSDLDFAASLTAGEGWDSETRLEIEGFYKYDPAGCVIAESQGKKIGMCIGTPYAGFGFLGELIVVPEQRGSGVGKALLEHTTGYLRAHGARSIFLDGVLTAMPLYERAGFVRICRSWRFNGELPGKYYPNVRAMRSADLETIAQLDHHAFGANRRFFLERRFELYPQLCKVLQIDNQIAGFIMARQGRSEISVGPWIVTPGLENPVALLESLALETANLSLRFGVLDTHQAAQATLEAFGFKRGLQSPWRMALGETELPGDPSLAFSIGSPAKG